MLLLGTMGKELRRVSFRTSEKIGCTGLEPGLQRRVLPRSPPELHGHGGPRHFGDVRRGGLAWREPGKGSREKREEQRESRDWDLESLSRFNNEAGFFRKAKKARGERERKRERERERVCPLRVFRVS